MTKKRRVLKPWKLKVKASEDLGMNFLEAAAHLAEVWEENPGFLPATAKELGVSRRKIYYLIRIYEQFFPLRVDTDRLLKIGWVKLALIADYVDQANCLEMLKLAETYAVRELKDLMHGVVPVPGTRCVMLYLEPKDYEIFETALIKNGAIKSGKTLIGKHEALLKALSGNPA